MNLMVLVVFAMSVAGPTTMALADLSHATAPPNDAARVAISAQAGMLMRAIELGDAAAVAAMFTDDAQLCTPGMAAAVRGRGAIEGFWRGALNGGLKALPLTADAVEGSGDVRIETGTYVARGEQGAELGQGNYLFVWKRVGADWKIFRDFANAAAPRPVATAAASDDRVGFPKDYQIAFKLLAVTARDDGSEIMTTYANEIAASVTHTGQLPYPNGSVIVMEFAAPSRDGEGQLLRDPSGELMKGGVAHVDVMRRGNGFGALYGDSRAGEWEFASYARDGHTLIPPSATGHCAACHSKAGADKDYVFRLQSRLPTP
jgi:ketosteroid isomerase-like protein